MCATWQVASVIAMRNPSVVLGLVCISAACTSSSLPPHTAASAMMSPSPSAAIGPPASPSPSPDDATRDDFFASIKKRDEAAVLAALERTPALAAARSAKGHSAFVVALTTLEGSGFVRPQDNRILAAILARHPALDGFEAAAAGDVARVNAEAARDPGYVRRAHAIGWTALHFAAFGGQPAVAEALLSHGAEIDAPARNKFANTPLQVGLLTRQPDVARVLIAHHASVGFLQSQGVTALHEAAISGDLASARMLLDAGADPNVRTGTIDDGTTGATPLAFAHKAGYADMAALLIAHGARE